MKTIFERYTSLIDSLRKQNKKDELKALFTELGRRGGESTKKKHGSAYYSRLGKKYGGLGGKNRWKNN